jgi:hypothetical protein
MRFKCAYVGAGWSRVAAGRCQRPQQAARVGGGGSRRRVQSYLRM